MLVRSSFFISRLPPNPLHQRRLNFLHPYTSISSRKRRGVSTNLDVCIWLGSAEKTYSLSADGVAKVFHHHAEAGLPHTPGL